MEKLAPGDPQRIGAYRLLARLGAGGMGQVYLARSDRGRTVAVKLVRGELARREEFRARFRREVRAARRVGGSWTAPVLDADTEAAVPWVATGYVAGPSLQRVVGHDHGALPERSVRVLAAGLACALRDIHSAGLVHRDLKPSNVLVTLDGPRVIDFGIARALDTVTEDGLTRTGVLVGSPGFMAPEQVRGGRVTPACDVFCLGSVLVYAATGALPFGTADSGVHALMYRIAEEEPDLTALPEGLAGLVRACLAKDPAARPTVDRILRDTGAEDAVRDGRTPDPWLPSALVAQLGRHAVGLLEREDPGGAESRGEPSPPVPAESAAASAGRAAAPADPAAAPADPAMAPADPAAAPADPAMAPADPAAAPADPAADSAPGVPYAGAAASGAADSTHTPTATPTPTPAPDPEHAGAPTPPPGDPGGDGRAPLGHPPTPATDRATPPARPTPSAPLAQPVPPIPLVPPPPPPAHPTYDHDGGPGTPQPHPHPYPHLRQHPWPSLHHSPPPGGPLPEPPSAPYRPLPFPPPQEPRRNGRYTAALLVVALVVALGAGGSVYALMRGGGQDDPNGPGPNPAPTATDPTGPDPSPTAPTASPGTPSPASGVIPSGYLGTWTATVTNAFGANPRRLTLTQGRVGDPVLTLVADGPTASGGTYHCDFRAPLSSRPAGGGSLEIGPSTVTTGKESSGCSPGTATEITLLPDGGLQRVNPDTGEELTYTRHG
ncbi:serine/threonine-protein kinase [Streptomyces sp. NPDC047017]|uniref:serine/threonine-protein kinase n=1 Tax=Streptomyces sp. NPDC047017 TaxID=3155024 RepID=UPI0033F7F215